MITSTLDLERKLWKSGYRHIAGIDEVGRGSFAGPVVVGAVIFPSNVQLPDDNSNYTLKASSQFDSMDINTTTFSFTNVSIDSLKVNSSLPDDVSKGPI